jgi:prepilin-type N-terminal cleavage/methylation domain-containing protein
MYHKHQRQSSGFTIVELLIVIVVIAILATITIVAYNGIQERARASSVASALNQANKKLALYQIDFPGQYPANLAAADITNTDSISYQYTVDNSTNPPTYCITATTGSTSYKASSTTTTPTSGGCPGHGQGGVAAITNLVLNPIAANNATNWSATTSTGGAPTGARITAQTTPLAGVTTAYRTTLGGTPATWWRVQNSQPTPVTAGATYTLSSYIRASVTGGTGVIIIWMDAGGAVVQENASTAISQTANTWARRSVTSAAPTGAVTARLQAYAPSGAGVTGATVDATGMMFVQSSTLTNYADGSSTDWAWGGTPHASTSSGPPL